MMIGTVLGGITLHKGIEAAGHKRWVQVRCGAGLVTALDPVGVLTGEAVMLAMGEGAGRLCPELPVDAVVLGVVSAGNKG